MPGPLRERGMVMEDRTVEWRVNMGLAAAQTQPCCSFRATGCDDLSSGNSNCGHECGTTLISAQKRALLEYLNTL